MASQIYLEDLDNVWNVAMLLTLLPQVPIVSIYIMSLWLGGIMLGVDRMFESNSDGFSIISHIDLWLGKSHTVYFSIKVHKHNLLPLIHWLIMSKVAMGLYKWFTNPNVVKSQTAYFYIDWSRLR